MISLPAILPEETTFLGLPTFVMVEVEGGSFEMGSDEYYDDQPIHTVTVPAFSIGKYPVTQELWELVMSENPSRFRGANHPVEDVSWDQVQVFLEKLNALPEIQVFNEADGRTFQLPSEAQWEYAARGGEHGSACRYAGSNRLEEVGWYSKNSHGSTHPVGLKQPNALNLYDMSGNVREWCADHWHDNYKGAPEDGTAWVKGGEIGRRVVRGGSCLNYFCQVSDRGYDGTDFRNNNFGFRPTRY